MKEYTLSERFRYWLDKKMSKGTAGMIRLLTVSVVCVVTLVAVLILIFHLRDTPFEAFWDSLATVINAWMPSSGDGSIGYIILNTVTAITGLLFTSILIGVISSAIESKLQDLREGNTTVIEKGHTVILGYNLGEHGLLNQLILETGKRKRVIVIFTNTGKTALEQDLRNNVDIPENMEVLCRNGDITNFNDLRSCAVEKSDIVIINALNDNFRIKAILAVLSLKMTFPECRARVVACVTSDKYMIPKGTLKENNITMFQTDDFMARIIALTSTGPGLSVIFKELLNFERNEFYFESDPAYSSKTVMELTGQLEGAVLAGVRHEGRNILNPSPVLKVQDGDELILFEKNKGASRLVEGSRRKIKNLRLTPVKEEENGALVIFGNNILLNPILDVLSEDIVNIVIVGEQNRDVRDIPANYPRYHFTFHFGEFISKLDEIVSRASHIIILADRVTDREDADTDVILLLLRLRQLQEEKGYTYNIAAELNLESSHKVAVRDSRIDYIVSSDIAALLLAQMSSDPRLEEIFDELLSREGNEVLSRPIRTFNLNVGQEYTVGTLKRIIRSYGYTLLGYRHEEEVTANPSNKDKIVFDHEDRLFVIGQQ